MEVFEFIPDRVVSGIRFYKYPYINIAIATDPTEALTDLGRLGASLVKDAESAAIFLQVLTDRIRSTGTQLFLYSEDINAVIPAGRLKTAVLSLDKKGNVYFTPRSGNEYSFEKLQRLFVGAAR